MSTTKTNIKEEAEVEEAKMESEEEEEDDVVKCKKFVVKMLANVLREYRELIKTVVLIMEHVKNLDRKLTSVMTDVEGLKKECENVKQELKKCDRKLENKCKQLESNEKDCERQLHEIIEISDMLSMSSCQLQSSINEVKQICEQKVDDTYVIHSFEKYAESGIAGLRGGNYNEASETNETDTSNYNRLAKYLKVAHDSNNNSYATCVSTVSYQDKARANATSEMPIEVRIEEAPVKEEIIDGNVNDCKPHVSSPLMKNRKSGNDNNTITANPICTSTPKHEKRALYTRFDEMPLEMRKQLKPFNKHYRMATKDKLNDVQRAYLKWYVKVNLTKGHKKQHVSKLLLDGETACIWSRRTLLENCKTLKEYIENRLKYEQKRIRKQSRESK